MTLRRLNHSAGIVFTTRDHVGDEASFHVDYDGELEELGGWGHAGPVPEIYINPPADPSALHVVTVSLDPEGDVELGALATIAGLVHEHLARYAECGTWSVGVSRALRDWVAAGCVVPVEETVEEAEEEQEPPAPPEPPEPPAPAPEPLDELDALRNEYNELTGQSPDGRWGIPRLTEEIKKAKVQAAKDRAAVARAGGQAETPGGTGSDGADT